MNTIQGNDPQLENFLLILAEHPGEKENIYPRIFKKLPWGIHPSIYIDQIKDPQRRMLIRESISKELLSKKIITDLNDVLEKHDSEDFLIKGAFLLTFFSNDRIYSYEEFHSNLCSIAAPLQERLDLLERPTEFSRIKIFLGYFFDELGFSGNSENPFLPENHYVHRVIEDKTGGSIALCILACTMARLVKIDLDVIITAGHFLLKTKIEDSIPYIDPFQKGKIISERDHMANIAQKGYDPSAGLLQINSPLIVYQRLIRNLMQTLHNSANEELYADLKEFHERVKGRIRNL